MALPEHKYYTLKQAAKKANCEIEDLIHFAAIGKLQLCIKTPDLDFSFTTPEGEGDESVKINFESTSTLMVDDAKLIAENPYPENLRTWEDVTGDHNCLNASNEEDEDEDEDEDEGEGEGEGEEDDYPLAKYYLRFNYQSEYLRVIEQYEIYTRDKNIWKWDGFLAIPTSEIYAIESEFDSNSGTTLLIDNLLRPRCKEEKFSADFVPSEFYCDSWLSVNTNDCYVTAYEMNLLLQGGLDIDAKGKPIIASHREKAEIKKENYSKQKASLIRSLIKLSFLSDGGIEKLSMESISEQLQEKFKRNNIEYDDINPANIRNYLRKAKAR
ncbi:hypothetical protein HGT73_08525 [Rosenbergiella australiborealis]|uniref:Uncharacterized protein n=1 Tax=Rosenbergiella australiborealis TaxID=1544696 RepID=A0ABS5T514_9GAMM|nr:hypothetical protein [Rosenbergiella australiborealis]MBT0727431.1 hypothetical protein [Rosenbergiella australiborealis]